MRGEALPTSPRGLNGPAISALAVVAAALILLGVYDTPLDSALVYLGFLLGYVYLPGWLLYRVLQPEPGNWIRQIALGGGLGYLLGVFAFMLTAEISTRWLFDFYPLFVAVPAGLILWSRYRGRGLPGAGESVGSGLAWSIAGVCVPGMAYVAIQFFGVSPIPGSQTVSYHQDFSWAISIAADVLHHWPMMEPSVSGEPVPYHNFIHMHLASASQVTGLDLPLVFFRLWILPVTVLAVLQFVEAGRSLLGSAAAGLLAAGLALLVSDAAIDSAIFFFFLIGSPSFGFGLVVLLPMLILVGERLRTGSAEFGRGAWVLLAIFAAGAGGAKVTILPLLIGALAIFGIYSWIRSRRFPTVVLLTGAIFSAVQLVYYLTLYRGHTSGLALDASAGIDFLNSVSKAGLVRQEVLEILSGPPGLDAILSVLAVPIALLALLGPPLIGLFWLFRRRNMPLPVEARWLTCVLLLGLAFLAVTKAVGTGNQLYFVYYGFVAGVLLSAAGIRFAWSDLRANLEYRRTIVLILGIWAAVVAVYLTGPELLEPDDQGRQILIGYLVLLAGLGLLWVLARRTLTGVRSGVALVIAAALVMVGLTTIPVSQLGPRLEAQPEPTAGYRMTTGMYGALRWLREETDVNDVFIVNNQRADMVTGYATAYDYAAFSERRAFLAGWGYSIGTRDAGYDRVRAGFNPFAARQELNDRAFAGDPTAIEELKSDYGVRYVVVDGVNGDPGDLESIRSFGKLVYRAPGVAVLDLGGD